MKVKINEEALEIIGRFFESYRGSSFYSDMQQRAHIYSRMRSCLTFFNAYTEDTYILNDKNCLDIDDICRVEFAKNQDEILIENVVFLL